MATANNKSGKRGSSKKTAPSGRSWSNWKKIVAIALSVISIAAITVWQESIKTFFGQHNPFIQHSHIRVYLSSYFDVPGPSALPVQLLAVANKGSKHSGEIEVEIQMQKGDISGFPNFRISGAAKIVDIVQTDTKLNFTVPRLAQNAAFYVTMYQVAPVRPSDVRVSDETRTILPSEIIQLQP